MQRVVLGTKNKDKRNELRSLLRGTRIEVLSLADFPPCGDVKESGRTFEQNAGKKARAYSLHTGLLTLADDSGLVVPVLGGRPGVYSARFAGEGCAYADNNGKLLRLLKKVRAPGRSATFVCVMALYDKGRKVAVARGECSGRIARAPGGRHGFGYDPVFIPRGFKKTFAEISPAAKNKISHRGRALRAAKKAILNYLKKTS